MHISSHPALIYILVLYSVLFLLFKVKTRNEFWLIFTLVMFFIERNSWQNAITSLTTEPIRTQPTDIVLIMLLILIALRKFNKSSFAPLFFKNWLVGLFVGFVLFSTLVGVLRFGYAGIAEFRTVFFYIIIMIFISTNVKQREIVPLIKTVSTYLIPLILLAPINLILTANYQMSIANRQFNALMYETITLGYLAGFLYYQYLDKKHRLILYFFPVYVAMIPYTTHRTVWAILLATVPFIFLWLKNKKYLVFVIIIGILTAAYIQMDTLFLQRRFTAITNFTSDATGAWRLHIWNAVIDKATFWGNGLGARFIVYAEVIGRQAMFGAHNGFIRMLYYLGYLGMGLMILLVCYFVLESYRNFQIKELTPQQKMVHRLSFLSSIALILYMIGYSGDVLSWVFISFSLKLMAYKRLTSKDYHGFPFPKNLHRNTVF